MSDDDDTRLLRPRQDLEQYGPEFKFGQILVQRLKKLINPRV
jgi:hypothetical protein